MQALEFGLETRLTGEHDRQHSEAIPASAGDRPLPLVG